MFVASSKIAVLRQHTRPPLKAIRSALSPRVSRPFIIPASIDTNFTATEPPPREQRHGNNAGGGGNARGGGNFRGGANGGGMGVPPMMNGAMRGGGGMMNSGMRGGMPNMMGNFGMGFGMGAGFNGMGGGGAGFGRGGMIPQGPRGGGMMGGGGGFNGGRGNMMGVGGTTA